MQDLYSNMLRSGRPGAGVRVNLAAPISRGLIGAWNMNQRAGRSVPDATGRNVAGLMPHDVGFDDGRYARWKHGALDYQNDVAAERGVLFPGARTLGGSDTGTIAVLCRLYAKQPGSGFPDLMPGGMWWHSPSDPDQRTCLHLSDDAMASATLAWHFNQRTGTADIEGTTVFGIGRTRLATVTFTPGDHRLYLDGKLEGTSSATGSLASDGEQWLGRPVGIDGAAYGHYFLMLVWKRALSPGEVRMLAADPYLPWRDHGRFWAYVAAVTYRQELAGEHRILEGYQHQLAGTYNLGYDRYRQEHVGVHSTLEPFAQLMAGQSAILNSTGATLAGAFNVSLSRMAHEHIGGHTVLGSFAQEHVGTHRVAVERHGHTYLGTHTVFNSFAHEHAGTWSVYFTTGHVHQGIGRVANDSLEAYVLYLGVNAPPDFDANPFMTSNLSSFTTPAMVGYPATYRFVLRKRNRYGLMSQNAAEWTVVLDAAGNPVAPAPSAPIRYAAAASGSGQIRLTAEYRYTIDGDFAGDTWRIYESTDGSDPEAGTDAPVDVAMAQADGIARLERVTSGLSDGAVYKAIVRVLRSSDDVESANTTIVTATATTGAALVLPKAGGFAGRVVEQGQGGSVQ